MFRTVLCFQCIIVFWCLATGVSQGAESTADVPFSEQQKTEILSEMLGPKYINLQREEEYVIGHGDILTVSIFEEGDMIAGALQSVPASSTDSTAKGVRVMMDGRISLKNIGDVEVVGLTLAELADYLKKLYSALYENPIVTTTLVQSNSLRYTVIGEVANAGIYQIDHPVTLVQIVARSGGFTEWAEKEITVVREDTKDDERWLFKNNTLDFDFDDFVSGNHLERNIFIRSGDIVIVK